MSQWSYQGEGIKKHLYPSSFLTAMLHDCYGYVVNKISFTLNLFSALWSKFLFTDRQFSPRPATLSARNTKPYFEIKKYLRITLTENLETNTVTNFLIARMFPGKWYGVSFYFSTLRISFLSNVVFLGSITINPGKFAYM